MNYTKSDEKTILKWLEKNLSPNRLEHSIGCAECAIDLAKKFGQDEKKAYVAGLLHDCAKCFTEEELLDIIKTHIPDVDEHELSNSKTLHAPASAHIAKKEFGIENEEIISAIRWHTLGKVDMNDFEKIIFLADKIEAKTRNLEYREVILKILDEKDGLNQALLVCYKETIKSLVKRDLKICQVTIDIYNCLQSKP